jgi:hypothetical protein
MLEINEQNHTSVLISSLDKIYNKGRSTGKLNSINLYILNIIYKLLDNCCIELTQCERRELMDLYRKIYFNSESICTVTSIKKYEITPRIIFVQAEAEDCNIYPTFENIYYWQETNLTNDILDIEQQVIVTGFFEDKLFDTEANFEVGADCTFTEIGYVCFAILDTLETDTYKIYDVLNNDITHMFDRIFVDDINTILFKSNNIYSHSVTNIKIKKTTDIYDNQVFNNIFNNIFN